MAIDAVGVDTAPTGVEPPLARAASASRTLAPGAARRGQLRWCSCRRIRA